MLKNLQEIMRGGVEQGLRHVLSDEFSEAEAAAVSKRVLRDPKYREDFNGSLDILAAMEALANDGEINAIADEFGRLLQKHRSRRSAVLGMAAGLLVAFGAALIYLSPWSGSRNDHLQKYFTRTGEQQTIELDDGSIVTLNTAGQLVVDYSRQRRRILLERGEAYFQVSEDPERPFTVDLGARSITTVATAFNVRKDPELYEIAVIKGAVALHGLTEELSPSAPLVSADGKAVVISEPAQHRVEAGWVVEFDARRNELTAFRPESMDRYQQWRSGMLSFSREPLVQVIQELNRYSRKRILIDDASVMELSVYTTVNVRELDAALNGLEQLLPIEVTRHYDRIVITGSGAN